MSAIRTPPGIDPQALEEIAAAGGLSSYRAALALDRQLSRSDAPPALRIVLGGNGSMEFLSAGLRVGAAAQGLDCQVELAAYDNWAAEALAGTHDADVWVIWHSAFAASRGETARDLPELEALAGAFAAIAARGAALIVVPPEPLPAEDDPFSPFGPWRHELAQRVLALLPETTIRFPVNHLQRQLGAGRWFAPRYWTLARAPCHPDAATLLGSRLAQAIAQSIRLRIKAIAVDLDDTLWGGVVGDDGAEALALDPFGAGRPYLALQRLLKDVAATGVPLCVVSKNDPERARSPFAARPEMVLRLEDFLFFDASWQRKSEALARVARELNIGLDALCFLDDSPHERAEARALLPALTVPDLPADPEARVPMLIASGLFQAPTVRRDDRERVARYAQEQDRRRAESAAVSHDDYLRGLAMELSAAPVADDNLSRVTALVQKTNQFNLTGRRHQAPVIRAHAMDRDAYAFAFSLSDRFGDAGTVAAVIARPAGDALELDSWVMSCRVFGRGVEFAILEHLLAWARERGLRRLRAPLVETRRNAPTRSFLDAAGFVERARDGDRVEFERDAAAASRHWLKLNGPAPGAPAAARAVA